MTKKELVKFLVDNFTDEDNRLDLSGLDFRDYELVTVEISKMKVNGSLFQSYHEVNGNLFQRSHKVSGSLLEGFSTYGEDYSYKKPAKQLKKITLEQLKEMGYELEEKK